MLNVFLLRHGQTAWNADNNRYCGRTDIPLTEKGIQQAGIVRDQLKGTSFVGVYSSPLERAFVTAGIAAGKPVIKDNRLIEADFGAWERKTKEEFIAAAPQLWHNWMDDPAAHRAGGTGETGLEIVTRVDDFFRELLQRHASGNVLVAAHNGVNRLYLAYRLGMPLKNYRMLVQDNATVTVFTLSDHNDFTLQHLNSKF
ncbi:MAG TPA: histidine phosphatase family protein [Chitinophaga sp.]|uniref:histidine phosphatase family protein n=1 Tax=Chitinophaga sp. TaxID=1869181 RepID=UPI002DBA2CE4|nr:histidine phosphatase family protein [Chitinophaga sp.]HEU4551281.1 histidine phosphatase family protein [Chitinophaga sp.]